MALPAKITDINTARFSDHLNSSVKPVQRIRRLGTSAGNDALRSLGDTSSNEAWGQKIVQGGPISFVMVMVKVQKVGSPTDSLVAKLYDFSSGTPGTLMATSTQVKASQITTTSRWVRMFFLIPSFFPTITNLPHVAIFRTGSFDASNYYKIDVDSSTAASGNEETHLSDGVWGTNDSARLMLLLHYAPNNWYTFLPGVDNKLHCYMTSDGGQTWPEQDSANAPSMISTSTFRSICVQGNIGGDENRIAKINSTSQGAIASFLSNSNTWLGDSSVTISAPAINVSGQCPWFGYARTFTSGTDRNAVVYQGPGETVMGSSWRRIKISLTNSTVTYDVAGSANTPSAALPGVQVHYDLRVAHMDDFGNIYIWYTQSDDSLLRLRIFKTNDTFCTILNPGSASTSNSAAYPLLLPTNLWRGGEAYVALGYVDGSATKVKTSKAGVDAETAGNWTVATVVASAAEVTASNPGTLVADNEAGGKLFLFRRRTDGTLGVSDDGGTGTWTSEANFRSGQTIAGVSAGALLNPSETGLTYQNTAPTPDEIQHDHL